MKDLSLHGLIGGGGGSNIKSIQRGTTVLISNSMNVTIAGVDITKSIVKVTTYSNQNSANNEGSVTCIGKLTTSTNLNLSVQTNNVTTVSWQVIEYNNVKSLQTGTFSLASTSPATVTIASVDLSKSYLIISYLCKTSTGLTGYASAIGQLTGETTLSLEHVKTWSGYVGNNQSIYWQVIEFN